MNVSEFMFRMYKDFTVSQENLNVSSFLLGLLLLVLSSSPLRTFNRLFVDSKNDF